MFASATLAAGALTIPSQIAPQQILPQAVAAPCPDGSGSTCGPNPGPGPQPTQGNQPGTTAPQAAQTTIPGQAPDTGLQAPTQGANTPTAQGNVTPMPTVTPTQSDCIYNCPSPTQQPQVPTSPQTPATGPAQTPQQSSPTAQSVSQQDIYQKCIEAAAQMGSLPGNIIGGGIGKNPTSLSGVCEKCIAEQADNQIRDTDLNSSNLRNCTRRSMSPKGGVSINSNPSSALKEFGIAGPNPRPISHIVTSTEMPLKVSVNGGLNFGVISGGTTLDLPYKTTANGFTIGTTVSEGTGPGQAPPGWIIKAVPVYIPYIVGVDCEMRLKGASEWSSKVNVSSLDVQAPVGITFIAQDPVSGNYVQI